MKKRSLSWSDSSGVLLTYYVGKALHYINFSYVLMALLPDAEMRGLYRGMCNAAFLLGSLDWNEAIMRYHPQFSKRKQPFFWGGLIVMQVFLFGSVAALFFLYVLWSGTTASKSVLMAHVGKIFLLGFIIQMGKLLKSWAIVLQRIVWPNFLQNIFIELLLLGSFYIYGEGYLSFQGLLALMVVPYMMHLLLLCVYLWKLGVLHARLPRQYIDRDFIHTFLSYSLWAALGSKIMTFLLRMDTLMLAWLWGDGPVGRYTDLLTIVALLDIPSKVNKQTTGPLLAKAFVPMDQIYIKKIYQRATFQQAFLASTVFVACTYNISYVLGTSGGSLLLLLGIGKVVKNIFSTSLLLLVLSPFFRGTIYLFVGFLPSLAANYFFIQKWHRYGAACGMLLGITLLGIIAAHQVWRKMRLHPFSKEVVYIIFLLGIFLSFAHRLPAGHHLSSHALRLLAPFLFYGIGNRWRPRGKGH